MASMNTYGANLIFCLVIFTAPSFAYAQKKQGPKLAIPQSVISNQDKVPDRNKKDSFDYSNLTLAELIQLRDKTSKKTQELRSRADRYRADKRPQKLVDEVVKEQQKLEKERREFDKVISDLINKAEKSAKEVNVVQAAHEEQKSIVLKPRSDLSPTANPEIAKLEINRLFSDLDEIFDASTKCNRLETYETVEISSKKGIVTKALVIPKSSRLDDSIAPYDFRYAYTQSNHRLLATQNGVPVFEFEEADLKDWKKKWTELSKLSPRTQAWAAVSLLSYNAFDVDYVKAIYDQKLPIKNRAEFILRASEHQSFDRRFSLLNIVDSKEKEGLSLALREELSELTRTDLVLEAETAAESGAVDAFVALVDEFMTREEAIVSEADARGFERDAHSMFSAGVDVWKKTRDPRALQSLTQLAMSDDQYHFIIGQSKFLDSKDKEQLLVPALESRLALLRAFQKETEQNPSDEARYELLVRRKNFLQSIERLERLVEANSPTQTIAVRNLIDLASYRIEVGDDPKIVLENLKSRITEALKLDRGKWGENQTQLDPKQLENIFDHYMQLVLIPAQRRLQSSEGILEQGEEVLEILTESANRSSKNTARMILQGAGSR